MTHADLIEQREALLRALSDGVRRVQFRDRETEFHSPRQIQEAIDKIDREIAAQIGQHPRTFLPTFSKGI